MRSALSYSVSGLIHATLLGMVVFGNAAPDAEKPRSLYDTAIRPEEKRVVWYHLQEKLPDVRSESAKADGRPLRATRVHEQRIVAGAKDDSRAPQVVRSPLPEAALPKPMALPNLIAVERKAPLREFTAPAAPPAPARTAEAKLPSAPAVDLNAAAAGANLAQLRKTFVPPVVKTAEAVKLPDAAPAVALNAAPAGANLAELRKTFVAPAPNTAASVQLPDAAPAVALNAAPAGTNLAELRKTFVAPAPKTAASVQLPDAAPAVALNAAPAGANLAEFRKAFVAPAAKSAEVSKFPEALPAAEWKTAAESAKVAVIGLNAVKAPAPTDTPASRNAGFSAGPTLNPKGSETDGSAAGITAPGVTVRDGISRQQLLAAVRPMANLKIPETPMPAPTTTRVSNAPDPALEGRVVYMMAIQMPNVTSHSGSWLVWYAAREMAQGTMHAPSPVRKVDPKYIASAVADGVEGIVRLGATIRRDGKVEAVRLLRRLDDRLDRSAMESLAKWEFEPATRDGAAVDVDAVFEIPFRLAPKLPR